MKPSHGQTSERARSGDRTCGRGPSIVPVACYSAFELAWQRLEQPVVAEYGVIMPMSCKVPFSPAGPYRHHRGTHTVPQAAKGHFTRLSGCTWRSIYYFSDSRGKKNDDCSIIHTNQSGLPHMSRDNALISEYARPQR